MISLFWNIVFNNIVFAVSQKEIKKEIKKGNTQNQKKESIKEKKTSKQLAIEKWKEKKQKMIKEIYKQTNISQLMDLSKAAQQLSQISMKLDNVTQMYSSFKKQKKLVDKKYKAVYDNAKKTILELKDKKKKLNAILFKIKILSKDIDNLKRQYKDLERKIFILKEEISKYVVALSEMKDNYYSDNKIDMIKLLLKWDENIAEVFSQEDITKILSKKTDLLIRKLRNSKEKKKKYIKMIYIKKWEYIKLVKDYNSEIKILNDKKKILIDMFKMLKDNKKWVDEYYKKLRKQRIDLKKQEKRITKTLKHKLDENKKVWTWEKVKIIDLSAVIEQTIKIDGDKFFNWPSRDFLSISAYYHDEKYFKALWWEHDGIDIRMRQGSFVYAPAAWYVYKVVDNDSDYYNYIVMVHNYGYISIYGHISKALVKPWQIVKRWQIIALSWWKKWTRWAGKMSTWPHLHFELYKNGQHIDPLSVLDLSVYPSKKYVPLKWQIKYMKDKLTRKIKITKLYSRKLSHKERQKQFLKRGASWFNDPDVWNKYGLIYGIDPDVAICIWYAESGLWNNTTTKNNIWNVWNNDRWDRVGISTPENGIKSIYYTLNNKYLSKYYTIYRLSRYGNKDTHIYSSSTYNWYKNVVKCLSAIKAHPIDEYYPFRIIPKNKYMELRKIIDDK